jgi:hypothetical protein
MENYEEYELIVSKWRGILGNAYKRVLMGVRHSSISFFTL